MRRTTITLTNPLGLHARAASTLVDTTKAYASKITFLSNEKKVDGKSIMSLLMLGAPVGTHFELAVDGDDEDAALGAICALIEAGFHEL